jgi:quinol monooxygenase YgiN
MTLRVIATFTIHPEKIDKAKTFLSNLVKPSRKEAGCIRYDLLQNASDPTDLTFDEEWVNEKAHDAHMKTPHVKATLTKFANLTSAPPDIRRYRQLA